MNRDFMIPYNSGRIGGRDFSICPQIQAITIDNGFY